ncbi:hypothetical protein [Nonomuraea jiangxiensis]|uniref:Uncharacterized protein n=1 Tax=Nonomuraea jiangxiensis TaxID=633440 RepID=A0A1G9BZY0_9ACTN|nr:hypothetical protein [Nonomuraea jiangxiensis]SDK44970.1 hypothetical protein SAMN05421869_11626 [Nonomuraea jiangxiensis]
MTLRDDTATGRELEEFTLPDLPERISARKGHLLFHQVVANTLSVSDVFPSRCPSNTPGPG